MKKGLIDQMEFESLIRELMLAMARGIGDLPVLVALEEHSLLMKAVRHEVASLKEGNRKNKRKREKNVLRDICLCCHKLETSWQEKNVITILGFLYYIILFFLLLIDT